MSVSPLPSATASTPEGRMLLTLLATTDPLGLLPDGGPVPLVYELLGQRALEELRAGADPSALFRLFVPQAGERVEAVHRFLDAALRWWNETAPTRGKEPGSAA